ncbi:MAG: hypothetical protein KatS3mg109_0632 [Pirellulaceae bacterium]|nr:MAG: hypothetical protein KatS3mg109_0632 [Pirellulaceae bacterium]
MNGRRTTIGLLLCLSLAGWGYWSLYGQIPSSAESMSFFMGRVRYSQNDGNDCSGVGRNMALLVSQVTTVPIRDEQKVSLNDPQLFQIPFLFMNGHNDFVLSAEELANLRTYLEHGGFLFASGCCTNPAFPRAWRRELGRVFPGESVEPLPYEHPIYQTFYAINSVRSLHQNRLIHLEGLVHDGRVVAVICEEGLCCAFSMDNRCNWGFGVSPEDGKKLALNIAVYAMTH